MLMIVEEAFCNQCWAILLSFSWIFAVFGSLSEEHESWHVRRLFAFYLVRGFEDFDSVPRLVLKLMCWILMLRFLQRGL